MRSTMSAGTPRADDQAIVVDGLGLSDEFQGIGALKQGGQQRGIYDYEESQRQEIMDFLFALNDPANGAGAAFQSLKVEIGGDGYSGEAAEPTFARTRAELAGRGRYRGDTWWWMWQARLRDSSIPIIAIAWGVPGWVGDTIPDGSWKAKYFSADNIDYLVRFLECARDADTGPAGPSLTVQYLGIWNETDYYGYEDWIYDLKQRLVDEGLDVKLVGADLGVNPDPDPLPAMFAARSECERPGNVCNAFDVVGIHYPGAGASGWTDDPSNLVLATRPPTADELAFARSCGKPLWSSEDAVSGILAFAEEASTRLIGEWYGALKLAHLLNTNYIYGHYVHTDVLFLANGMMSDILYAPGAGLISANRPYAGGHFDIQPGLWAVAHTTQFAPRGWWYIESACGGLTQDAVECTHDASSEGSYVTLSDGVDYSIVVETNGARAAITKTLVLRNLPLGRVHVWVSDEKEQLRKLRSFDPGTGQFTVTFEPNRIYTLTTTTGQGKRTPTTSLPQQRFPDPYVEDFDGYGTIDDSRPASRNMPRLITTQEGSFELVPAGSYDNPTACLEQKVAQPPTEWPLPWWAIHPGQRFGPPHAIFGDDNWTNYDISVDARFVLADGVSAVSVLGRLQAGASDGGDFQRRRHYELRVTEAGDVRLLKHYFVEGVLTERVEAGPRRLANALGTSWFSLRLRLNGHAVEGYVDGASVPIVSFVDTSRGPDELPFLHGPAGIGTGWNKAMFDNLAVESLAGLVSTFDDTELTFGKPGTWIRRACAAEDLAYNDTMTSSNNPGDRATLTFTGTGVVVYGTKGQNGGRAQISVDGQHAIVADFFREARAIGEQVVYGSPQLPYGPHTLTIEVLGSGQPGQADLGVGTNFVHVDRVDVIR